MDSEINKTSNCNAKLSPPAAVATHGNSKAFTAAIDFELVALVWHLGVLRKTLTSPEVLNAQWIGASIQTGSPPGALDT
jgi:hypothetical protein